MTKIQNYDQNWIVLVIQKLEVGIYLRFGI